MKDWGELDEKAQLVSRDLLARIDYQPQSFQAVPIRALARALDVEVVEAPSSPSRGALSGVSRAQPGLFGDFEVAVWDRSSGRRFTLAHELGHRAADLYVSAPEVARWTAKEQRVFADRFAAYVLLPDGLITESFGLGKTIRLDLPTLKRIQRAFGVSMSALVARLNSAAGRGLVTCFDFVLVAAAGLSIRMGTNYAPRVLARCVPRGWYIPLNKRLESLGLAALDRLYLSAPLYCDGVAEDSMKLWFKEQKQSIELTRVFQYVVFQSIEGQRILVAVSPE